MTPTGAPPAGLAELRPGRAAGFTAFNALLRRDLHVVRKDIGSFLVRTLMSPLLTVFVFAYVFPKIGQGVGGGRGEDAFSTLLVPGVIATACIFQGIQAVALPLVQEFGYTREIEDRVLAPLPVWAVAVEKLVSGALQGVLAGMVVFPLANFVPAIPVHLSFHWPLLLIVAPLSALLGASLGLAIGTRVAPPQVPLVFSILVIPIIFLGATYYPWSRLGPIPWLKWAVLANPLVYMSEGLRASLTDGIPHMPLPGMFAGLIAFTAGLAVLGVRGFQRRVIG
ncbi:MAG TPA: ABC transporter permease [Acidimicrobiales bacterium]|nr:ABC transporter permease [Acidimicrobiales bacterium]